MPDVHAYPPYGFYEQYNNNSKKHKMIETKLKGRIIVWNNYLNYWNFTKQISAIIIKA
jgi:hypothetical protein